MSTIDELVPRPRIIRERLAQVVREADHLRRLLRVSVAVAEERAQRSAQAPRNSEGGAS